MRRYVLASLTILLVIFIAWITLQECGQSEPSYGGKTLTQWLDQYSSNMFYYLHEGQTYDRGKIETSEARNAITHIGTNGLQTLVNLASSKDLAIKPFVVRIMGNHSFLPFHWCNPEHDHLLAYRGFEFLGPTAKQAVPQLIKLLSNREPSIQRTAVQCLGLIGSAAEDAVPALVMCLDSDNSELRMFSLVSLRRILDKKHTELIVKIIIKNLSDPKTSLGVFASNALDEYGTEATPTLRQLLIDQDEKVRIAAANALLTIDPTSGGSEGKKDEATHR